MSVSPIVEVEGPKMPPFRVVVGVEDPNRFDELEGLLSEFFNAHVRKIGGLDELKRLPPRDILHLLVVDWELPGLPEFQDDKFSALRGLSNVDHRTQIFVLVESNVTIKKPKTDYYSNVSVFPISNGRIDGTAIRVALTKIHESPPGPEIHWDESIVFNEQMQWLNPRGRPVGARLVLQQLLRQFRQWDVAHVKPLTQGFSGALVLAVNGMKNGLTERVVMKIVKDADVWKLRRSAESWPVVLGLLSSHLQSHVPRLLASDPQLIDTGDTSPVYSVTAQSFTAEFWDFLGGEYGEFRDWESIHWNESGTGTASYEFLNAAIGVLRETLYSQATWNGPDVSLWTNDELEQKSYPKTPPYGLTRWWKARILASLFELKLLANRIYDAAKLPEPTNWNRDVQLVEDWLTKSLSAQSLLAAPSKVLRSYVHGDLNKNNLLVWQKHGRPIFIDFSTFQTDAHTLQDFANMENQVMFALMDREYGNASKGLDYCPANFVSWQLGYSEFLALDQIQSQPHDSDAADRTNTHGVSYAVQLVGLIRRHAKETFDRATAECGCPNGRFAVEYAAALLYPTLRSIGYYDSLSPYKRIFATWSAARLIRELTA